MVGRFLPQELMPGSTSPIAELTTILAQGTALDKASEIFQQLAAEGRRVFYEIDDDYFHLDRSNPAYQELSQPNFQRNYSRNLAVARGVIVTTRALGKVVAEHTDAPVFVIPNYIPEWLLHQRMVQHDLTVLKDTDSIATRSWKRNAMVVGWAGSHAHAMDWEHIAPRLVQWVSRNRNSILHVMGAVDYLKQFQRELPPGRSTGEGWSLNIEDYLRRICFDVSVLPLRKHVFNESKSWIKALECGAYGIPVVASDVGPYHDYVLHGQTGFLFQTPGQMAGYLDDLRDPDLRGTLGYNARVIAQTKTYEANGWQWADVLQT